MRLHFSKGTNRYRRPAIYRLCWSMSRWVAGRVLRGREAGWEHVPLEGPLIVAANHASFMDPPMIGASCPRALCYLGRESLFSNWAVGWLLRAVGSVALDRDGTSGKGLKTILERLLAGEGIILFPEGTRTMDGNLQPGRAGIGMIALRSKAPVVPVRVFGTFESWGRHRKWPRRWPIGVRFGRPLSFDSLVAEAETASRSRVKEIYQEVADEIVSAIARLDPP
ncbi:MAG: lysophospholipid acyltransferase family protein [Limisphaerales bacterium]